MTAAYIVSFILILLKLEHALITADLLNQNPTKKVMLLYKKLFQLDVANGCLSRVLNTIITDKIIMIKITWTKRLFSTFSFTERQ